VAVEQPARGTAGRIAELYRTRWRVERSRSPGVERSRSPGVERSRSPGVERSRSPGIEGMFGRLERVLRSELRSLGHPRAALLGFAAAVLAYNVPALLQRAVEPAHQSPPRPAPPSPAAPPPSPLEVSCFHLAQQVRGGYEGLLIALPPEHWPRWSEADPAGLAQHLLRLARRINPRQVATSKRGSKAAKPRAASMVRPHAPTSQPLACSQKPTQHPERGGFKSLRSRRERRPSARSARAPP
jgi:hypothetical protein